MIYLNHCPSGNPIRCTCLLQGLKKWALRSGIKLYGACAWPPHLSDEPLENVQEQDLRCRPQDELMPDEIEKEGKEEDGVREKAVPTAKPQKKNKCPKNCQCEVRKDWRSVKGILVIYS